MKISLSGMQVDIRSAMASMCYSWTRMGDFEPVYFSFFLTGLERCILRRIFAFHSLKVNESECQSMEQAHLPVDQETLRAWKAWNIIVKSFWELEFQCRLDNRHPHQAISWRKSPVMCVLFPSYKVIIGVNIKKHFSHTIDCFQKRTKVIIYGSSNGSTGGTFPKKLGNPWGGAVHTISDIWSSAFLSSSRNAINSYKMLVS